MKGKTYCRAWDAGIRCRRIWMKRYKGKELCNKHYLRAWRSGGETRTKRELASIKAKARIAKLAVWRKELLSK